MINDICKCYRLQRDRHVDLVTASSVLYKNDDCNSTKVYNASPHKIENR